jgi:acetyltransferase
MTLLIDYARAEGIGTIVGTVLEENETMLRMCRELGFETSREAGDPGVVHVALTLQGAR